MTYEELINLGVNEEQATKISDKFKNLIPKDRFDEVNTALKQKKDMLEQLNKDLSNMRASIANVETLKQKISELQADNEAKEKEHTQQLKKLARENIDNELLLSAKAKNTKAAKALLDNLNDDIDEADYKTLRLEQIKKLSENEKYLLGDDIKLVGLSPADKTTETPLTRNPFIDGNADEMAKLYRDNPEMAKALMKKAGIRVY